MSNAVPLERRGGGEHVTRNAPNQLTLFERWLATSEEQAEGLLPELLDLSPGDVRNHLLRNTHTITVSLINKILSVAHYCLDAHPLRALELTQIAVDFVDLVRVPVGSASVLLRLKGAAWKEHANALAGRGRLPESVEAIETARQVLKDAVEKGMLLARIDLVEAQTRIRMGEFEKAVSLTASAARALLDYGDDDGYMTARMTEAWVRWREGKADLAMEVWRDALRVATEQNNEPLRGRIYCNMGLFEVRHGLLEEGVRHLREATRLLQSARLTREVIRVRWNLAEAEGLKGNLNAAISELYKVRAEFLRIGAVLDAANASVMAVDYLIVAGRTRDIEPLAREMVRVFHDAGLTRNALEALSYLRSQAVAGDISRDDTRAVLRYFDDLPQQPLAEFILPRG